MSKKKGNKGEKRIFLSSIILSFVACFMFFFYAPVTLYFKYSQDIWFSIYDLLPATFMLFVVAFVISALVFFVLSKVSKTVFHAVLVVYFMGFVAAFIQGNLLKIQLPKLTEGAARWGHLWGGRILSILVWILVIAAIAFLVKKMHLKKFSALMNLFSVALLLVMIICMIISGVIHKGFAKKYTTVATTEHEFEYSDIMNMVVFVVDSVDGHAFDYSLIQHSEYMSKFADFTYYSDTMGCYTYDDLAIPYILSGKWYEQGEGVENYRLAAYENNEFLETLSSQGYQLGMYDETVPVTEKTQEKFDNIKKVSCKINSKMYLNILETKMVAYYYAPFDLKRLFAFDLSMFDYLKGGNKGTELVTMSNKDFYDNLTSKDITKTENRTFKFIHIDGAQPPFVYDKDMQQTATANYETSIDATVTILDTYLQKLREAGVYDKSVIVILSDHGYNYNQAEGRQHPILLVKGYGESHEMYNSSAPVSHEDLQIAFKRLMTGTESGDIFDYYDGDVRERKYYFYNQGEADEMIECCQLGFAGNSSTLFPTGLIFQ